MAGAGRRLLLAALMSLALVAGCGARAERVPTVAEDASRAVASPPPATESALRALASSPDRVDAYLGLSALMGWYRAAGRFDASSSLLKDRLASLTDAGLRPLVLLWYGDEALYTGEVEEAIRRYGAALDAAQERSFLGRRLSTEILGQRALARLLSGDVDGAEADLISAARDADRIRAAALIRRAADNAWITGNRRRAADLRLSADELISAMLAARSQPHLGAIDTTARIGRDQARAGAWRVPDLATLGLKAPWEAGISQRAGGIGPGFGAWLAYAARGFTRGRKADACGRGVTGYYYARGSHRAGWQAGRDRYAIDFTRGRHQGSRFGNDSFGIQLRAAAAGIVTHAYYGTRTFWNAWDTGPAPEANRVDVLHFLGERGLMASTLADLDEPWAIYSLKGLQSWSLHMAGLSEPCDAHGDLCLERPALVSFGQFVWQGAPLGYEDSSGLSALSHLHFALVTPCSARDARCAVDDPRLTHVSQPVAIEGRRLEDRDAGACVTSTNTFSLGEARPGLPPAVSRLAGVGDGR